MKEYNVYIEGYSATGERGVAKLFGTAVAESFKDACGIVAEDPELEYYDPERLTYWGCRLFDNLKDAQKGFG